MLQMSADKMISGVHQLWLAILFTDMEHSGILSLLIFFFFGFVDIAMDILLTCEPSTISPGPFPFKWTFPNKEKN